jgi:hypothetical protein
MIYEGTAKLLGVESELEDEDESSDVASAASAKM